MFHHLHQPFLQLHTLQFLPSRENSQRSDREPLRSLRREVLAARQFSDTLLHPSYHTQNLVAVVPNVLLQLQKPHAEARTRRRRVKRRFCTDPVDDHDVVADRKNEAGGDGDVARMHVVGLEVVLGGVAAVEHVGESGGGSVTEN